MSRIYHLSTFFRAFSLEERGKHEIHVCLGTACHVRGAPRILEAFERGLKIPAGKTTPDLEWTLETVNCVGACALGPVVIADEKSVGKMTPQKAERLLKQMDMGDGAGGKTKKTAAAKTKKKAPAARKAAKKKAAGDPGRGCSAAAAKKKPGPKKGKKTTRRGS